MIETTARRDRRTSTRLDQLISQATTEQRPWHDVFPSDSPLLLEPRPCPPDPPEPAHPATARSPDACDEPLFAVVASSAGGQPGGRQPEEHHAAPPGQLGADRLADSDPPRSYPPTAGLARGWPAAGPWWRRAANRLFERWLPDRSAEPPRWRLAVLAAAGVLLGVAVAVGFTLSGTHDQPEVPPALPAASVSEMRTSAGATAPGSGGSIVISVVGRIARPGLVTLPEGARVADALEAAGGPAPGTNLGGLNLARRLSDGEQIYVGVPAPPGAEPPQAAPGGQSDTARVDLNSASLAALDTLPGVGPVTAQRILDWRTQHGRFASVDQLREIEGIGPTRFAKLKDLVVAG